MSLWNNINILLKIFQISTLLVWRSTSISSSSWCRWASRSPRTRRPPSRPVGECPGENNYTQEYRKVTRGFRQTVICRLSGSGTPSREENRGRRHRSEADFMLRVGVSTSVQLISDWGYRQLLITKRRVFVFQVWTINLDRAERFLFFIILII